MKSLRTLRAAYSGPKKTEEHAQWEIPCTPARDTPSLSLNFEASPPDRPYFDPITRTTSASSSMQVNHSSPIAVPSASRHTTPVLQYTPPGKSTFAVGTIPKSPAPLQKVSVQEAIKSNAARETVVQGQSRVNDFIDPHLTPMPGTNLPLEDNPAPNIVITSPSAPSIQHGELPGYFDIIPTPDEGGYERTSSLVTESGFPTANETPDISHMPIYELDSGDVSPQPAFSDPPASMDNHSALGVPAYIIGSGEHGEELSYIIFDESDATTVPKNKCSARASVRTRASELYDGAGYGSTDATTGSSHQWTDSTDAATSHTDLSDGEEGTMEARLLAASKELPPIRSRSTPSPPVDNEQAIQDIVRAYARPIYREEIDDEIFDKGSVLPTGETIPRELREEVETSIRVMNRSLGG